MKGWNEAEDGRPGALPLITEQPAGLLRGEVVRWACPVRLPWGPRLHLVLRAYTATAEVTVALEPVP